MDQGEQWVMETVHRRKRRGPKIVKEKANEKARVFFGNIW